MPRDDVDDDLLVVVGPQEVENFFSQIHDLRVLSYVVFDGASDGALIFALNPSYEEL